MARRAAAWVLLKLARLLARLPYGSQARLIARAERLVARMTNGRVKLGQAAEIREMLQTDPRGSAALRRILLESRDRQAVSQLAGAMKHYAGQTAPAERSFVRVKEIADASPPTVPHIAFLGDAWDFPLLREAYDAAGRWRLVDGADPAVAARECDALEIALDRPEAAGWAAAAIVAGKAVSLHLGGAVDAEVVRQLLAKARRYGVLLRVFDPYLYHPPIAKLKAMLARGEIGEVATIRVRAVLAGKGGRLQLAPPFGEAPWLHPAFDHFLLLSFLGGSLAKLTAYVQPMDPQTGGQALIACQYAAAGRYGLLECAYAPEMYVRSEHCPHDLTVEVAGTDGVIWMRRGMATATQEPPLAVRVGKQAYTLGIERGMTADWRDAYRLAVAEMGEAMGGRLIERLPAADLVAALLAREKVGLAAAGERTISL